MRWNSTERLFAKARLVPPRTCLFGNCHFDDNATHVNSMFAGLYAQIVCIFGRVRYRGLTPSRVGCLKCLGIRLDRLSASARPRLVVVQRPLGLCILAPCNREKNGTPKWNWYALWRRGSPRVLDIHTTPYDQTQQQQNLRGIPK